MWPWIAALIAGGLVVSHFSSSVSDDQKVQMAVHAALVSEKDPNVLVVFAGKLRAAGYDQEAAALQTKATGLYGVKVSSIARTKIVPTAGLWK